MIKVGDIYKNKTVLYKICSLTAEHAKIMWLETDYDEVILSLGMVGLDLSFPLSHISYCRKVSVCREYTG